MLQSPYHSSIHMYDLIGKMYLMNGLLQIESILTLLARILKVS